MGDVYDVTGHWSEIQAAVTQAGAQGTVYLRNGTFNFCDNGESWHTISNPNGISIVAATPPTGADSLGIPTTWNTILKANIDSGGRQDNPSGGSPGKALWFKVGNGTYNASKLFRFSGIKVVGYRYSEATAIEMEMGLEFHGVKYRIDHSSFENLGGGCWYVPNWYQDNMSCHGVADHSRFYNTYGFDDLAYYYNGNIDYAANLQRAYYSTPSNGAMPFPPTMDVLGKDTVFTHFIENCYLSKWRHCISPGHGAYYVFRHNLVDQDFAHFSLDVHGLRDAEAGRAGGRGFEVYENTFTNNVTPSFGGLFQDGGGCGAWFNNYVDTTYFQAALYPEDYVASPTWHLQDFYMWSAKGPASINVGNYPIAGRNVGLDWARIAGNEGDANYPNVNPAWSIAGYKPYVYPHPLVSEVPPPTQPVLRVNSLNPSSGIPFTVRRV